MSRRRRRKERSALRSSPKQQTTETRLQVKMMTRVSNWLTIQYFCYIYGLFLEEEEDDDDDDDGKLSRVRHVSLHCVVHHR